MPWIAAGTLKDLELNGLHELRVGDDRIALCRVQDQIHAVDGLCPHMQGPLAFGALDGNLVSCPWHAWAFDCTTGICDFNPDVRLAKYAVRVEGDVIWVEWPEPNA
jgi:nitrite reductase/ring-hydroxylating ferredoxin subunit